ncbi:conserved hypothetical protein [Hyella patelloides LEGE 07179]|uniref:DnaD domain-containing protein n=1 Tax=Hyella patelloides LEGE 07179 TaxID=945734 RepID=A0A563VYS1_9CYAN|nr:hypothetical protein [Hyella patelloides]VEP16604.1 conserved hypothetical protein [Hyella patelloides LEGE 07179]
MSDLNQNLAIAQIITLMTSYSFDTDQNNVEELVQQWQKIYHVHWIYLATIEALYLGRYKAISIEQIMNSWLRSGQPKTHFGGEFERLISRKLPRHLSTLEPVKEKEQETVLQFSKNNYPTFESKTQIASNRQEKCSQDRSTPQPNLNDKPDISATQNLHLSTKVTPVPKPKIVSSTSSHKKANKTQKIAKKQSHSQGITTFQPLPDGSGFFRKLKEIADNQRQEEQDE